MNTQIADLLFHSLRFLSFFLLAFHFSTSQLKNDGAVVQGSDDQVITLVNNWDGKEKYADGKWLTNGFDFMSSMQTSKATDSLRRRHMCTQKLQLVTVFWSF